MQKSKESNSYRDGSEEWDNGGCWGRQSENNNTTLGGNQGKQRSECGMQLAFVHVLENKPNNQAKIRFKDYCYRYTVRSVNTYWKQW